MDFLLFGKWGKWKGVENQEKTFSQDPQIFVSPIREKKLVEKSIFTILASPPTLITFTPTHLMTFAHKSYHFFFGLFSILICHHSTPGPGSLLLFFSFFPTWSTVSCGHYTPHPSIVSCWFFGFGWHSIFLHYNNKNNNINLYIWCDKFYII